MLDNSRHVRAAVFAVFGDHWHLWLVLLDLTISELSSLQFFFKAQPCKCYHFVHSLKTMRLVNMLQVKIKLRLKFFIRHVG